MKSFAKTFRTFLAMSLVLCMVMSCVTVSADGTVTLSTPTVSPLSEGYYQVQYTVGGIPEGGSATILVYDKGEEISNTTIEYANQTVATTASVDEEAAPTGTYEATFTMLLGAGDYEVKAGGTSYLTAATGEVKVNEVPVVTLTAYENIKDDVQPGTPVADYTVSDANETLDVTALTLSDTTNFAIGTGENAGKIVTVAELEAKDYALTLTAKDSVGDEGSAAATLTVATSIETAVLLATTKDIYKDWNTTEITAPTVADYIALEGATLSDWVEGETVDKVTTYTATVTLPTGYQFEGGTTTATVTYTVTEIDTRTVVKLAYTASYAVNYGEAKPEFGAITFVKADGDTAIEIPAENVTLGGWEGDKFNSEVNNGATYTYTNAVTLSGPYKFEDDNLTATASVTVTVTDDRQEISVPKFDDTTIYYGDAEPVEALEELAANNVTLGEWVRENAEEEFDSCVDGGTTYTYTNKATANAKFKFAEGALEAPVEVTVIVKDERTEITAVKLSETDIPVAWNGAEPKDALKAITATAIAGEVETELELELSEFKLADEEEFNNQEENHVNTYYAVASIPAASVNDFKFASAEVANVKVTVTIEEKVTITATPVGETTFTVPYGTDIETAGTITTTYTATVEGTDPVNVPVTWNYEDFNKEVPDEYIITGILTAPEGYKFTEGADAVSVTVVVDKKVINIADVVVNPATINVEYGEAHDFSSVTVKAFEDVELATNATWTCADDDTTTPGEHIYTNTVALTEEQKATYKFAEGADAVSITVFVAEPSYVIEKYEFVDDEGNVVTEVEVDKNTNWDAALELFPLYIKLYSGDLSMTAVVPGDAWINHNEEEDGFPPAEWTSEDFAVDKSEITLEEYWKWDEDATNPTIKVTTKGTPSADAFVVKADGYDKKYVASRIGAESVITVEPAVEGGTIAGATGYAFSVNGGEKTWSATPSYTIEKNDEDANGTRYTVEAFVQYEDGSELSKTIYVTKYPSVFSGSVYINDYVLDENGNVQATDTGYSAVRSNRNRDLVVSYKYVNANGEAMDGSATLYIYHVDDVNDPEAEPTTYEFTKGETSLVIPAAEVQEFAAVDGEYKFYVEYKDAADSESAEDIAKAERIGGHKNRKGTYISNNGTWYSKFAINDMSRSGIIIRRNEKLINDVELTELGADGKAYVGYNLLKWGTAYDEAAKEKEKFEEEPVTTKSYQHSFDVESAEIEATNAAYTFYSLVRLDGINQGYDDMKASRTVYIHNSKTTISNLKFGVNGKQGATAGPVAEEGYITIAPYWYQEFSKDTYDYDEIRYELEFTAGTSYDRLKTAVKDGEVVEDTTIVKFADTGVGANSEVGTVAIDVSAFDSKVVAVLRVYVDDVLDRTVNKTFWPQAQ